MQVRDAELRKHLVRVGSIIDRFPLLFQMGRVRVVRSGNIVWDSGAPGQSNTSATDPPSHHTHIHTNTNTDVCINRHTHTRIQTHTQREYEQHKHKFEHIKICSSMPSGFTLSGRIFCVRESNRVRGANLATTNNVFSSDFWATGVCIKIAHLKKHTYEVPPSPNPMLISTLPGLSASGCEINAHSGSRGPVGLFFQHCVGGRGESIYEIWFARWAISTQTPG